MNNGRTDVSDDGDERKFYIPKDATLRDLWNGIPARYLLFLGSVILAVFGAGVSIDRWLLDQGRVRDT
jgi:hypothetical protein